MTTTADVISQTSSIRGISKSISATNSSISNANSSINRIQKIISSKTKIRNELFLKNQAIQNRRREASKRKELEDQLESSKVSTNFQSGLSAVSASNQGPLGRILSFLAFMGAGWIIENMPTWTAMGKEFILRMKKAGELIYSIPQTMWRVLQDFGRLLGSVGQNILNLDFTDSSGEVKSSLEQLNSTVELLGNQIYEGFKMLMTPTGEVDIPSTGEQQPDELPSSGRGTPGSGGKLKPIHYQALEIIAGPESGGDYNAMNNGEAGDRPGGSKKWLKKNLTDMTIGEIKYHQNVAKDLWAAGKYQFVPNTLPGVAASAGLKDKDLFDKNNQDLMAITLVQQRGIQPWTVGGSKYSAKEIAIVEQARKTPLGQPTQSSTPPPTSQSSTSFAPVTGTSGASMGNKPASVPYSPFKPGSGATITSVKGMRNGKYHTGYDLAAAPGTPIHAYFPGKVTHIGLEGTATDAGYGNWVAWKDDVYGSYHFFGHMKDAPPVRVGQTVNQGTVMGTVGSTGKSIGPHLHWEISNQPPQSNGQFVSYEDPGVWLRAHPLKKTSSTSPQMSMVPSESNLQPSSTTQPKISSFNPEIEKKIAEAVAVVRNGQQILFIDDRNPQQTTIPSSSSGGYNQQSSGQISQFDMLNNFIKQNILLNFNYL